MLLYETRVYSRNGFLAFLALLRGNPLYIGSEGHHTVEVLLEPLTLITHNQSIVSSTCSAVNQTDWFYHMMDDCTLY